MQLGHLGHITCCILSTKTYFIQYCKLKVKNWKFHYFGHFTYVCIFAVWVRVHTHKCVCGRVYISECVCMYVRVSDSEWITFHNYFVHLLCLMGQTAKVKVSFNKEFTTLRLKGRKVFHCDESVTYYPKPND